MAAPVENMQSSSLGDNARLRSDCAVHMRWALLLQDTLRQVQKQRETEETLCKQHLAENKKLRQHLLEREPDHPLQRIRLQMRGPKRAAEHLRAVIPWLLASVRS